MEPEKHSDKKTSGQKWIFFATGIVIGIILGIATIICYNFLNNNKSYSKPNNVQLLLPEYPDTNEEDNTKTKKESKIVPTEVPDSLPDDIIDYDTLETEQYDDADLEEVEFESDMEDDVTIWKEEVSDSRTVKVQLSENDTTADQLQHEYIEIEEWISPIKNKHSYHFKNNVLKITGISISQLRIIYENGNYYLINGERHYLLMPNNGFEKMIEIRKTDNDQ